jgi:glutathione S-transferase
VKLYGYKNGRTLRARWALEEAGVAYDYVEIDLFKGEGQSADFLKINPAGKVPVLVDGDQTITESAAICLHIGEKYPESGLLPLPGTRERTDCYRWISFVLTELDSALWTVAKHRFALPKEKRVDAVLDIAAWEYGVGAKILSEALEETSYLVGDKFSVADIVAGHVLLWARSARLEILSGTLQDYLTRLEAREGLRRAQQLASAAVNRSPSAGGLPTTHQRPATR